MAKYTIDIPDELHQEIQDRRHRIDVTGICREALADAVAESRPAGGRFLFGRDVAEDITRMFNGESR